MGEPMDEDEVMPDQEQLDEPFNYDPYAEAPPYFETAMSMSTNMSSTGGQFDLVGSHPIDLSASQEERLRISFHLHRANETDMVAPFRHIPRENDSLLLQHHGQALLELILLSKLRSNLIFRPERVPYLDHIIRERFGKSVNTCRYSNQAEPPILTNHDVYNKALIDYCEASSIFGIEDRASLTLGSPYLTTELPFQQANCPFPDRSKIQPLLQPLTGAYCLLTREFFRDALNDARGAKLKGITERLTYVVGGQHVATTKFLTDSDGKLAFVIHKNCCKPKKGETTKKKIFTILRAVPAPSYVIPGINYIVDIPMLHVIVDEELFPMHQ